MLERPKSSQMRTHLGLFLVFLGVLGFSLTLPMTRMAVSGFTTPQVAVWRLVIAAIVALIILLLLRPTRPLGRQWLYLSICSFGTVFGFPIFSTLGMNSVTASHGAVIVGVLPLATAICAAIFAGEKPSALFWFSSVLGTLFTLVFIMTRSTGGITLDHIWLLLAVVTAAVGYSYGGMLTRTMSGWSVACWALIIAFPILFAASVIAPLPIKQVSLGPLVGLIYLALVSQLLAFFCFYKGLAIAGIARGSQLQLIQLFLTLIFASVFFGETWEWETLGFGLIVVATVALGVKSKIKQSD